MKNISIFRSIFFSSNIKIFGQYFNYRMTVNIMVFDILSNPSDKTLLYSHWKQKKPGNEDWCRLVEDVDKPQCTVRKRPPKQDTYTTQLV